MFLRHERGELRALRCELLKQRSGLRICAGGCTMPGGSEAGERYRLLPQNEIVHSGCYAGIGFAIGVGKTGGTREEILHRAEERSAVLVTHGRRRLRDLRAKCFFAAMKEFLGFRAIPFVVIENGEILDCVAGARMIWAEDFFADGESSKQKWLGFVRLVLGERDFGGGGGGGGGRRRSL